MLDLATPFIYRRNSFRVLGVPVNASNRDVERLNHRRKIKERCGIAAKVGSSAFGVAASEEEIRTALERVSRPVDRFLDEMFWFWPIHGNADDPALESLQQGDVDKARKLWKEQLQHSDDGIATHNLAVLAHLLVLDEEIEIATTVSNTPRLARIEDRWRVAFTYWKILLANEKFWTIVNNRVRQINDAQLTTGQVRGIRETLPKALLLINARIAYSAAEKADRENTQRHLRLLREANLENATIDQALQEAIKPLRSRIMTAIDTAGSQWKNAPHRGNQYLRDLYRQSRSLVAIVDAALPADHLTRTSLRDRVAETMLEGQVAFGKKTNDWRECIKLLELAREFAAGESIRSRLSENIKILGENEVSGNDWYVSGYWDLPEDVVSQLELAHDKAESGDYDGAIAILSVLDPGIGKPLRRCVSYCLCLRGVVIGNQALSAYNNKLPEVIERILNKLREANEDRVIRLLTPPDPYSQTVPPCPSCERTDYQRWLNFTYRDISMYMCGNCSTQRDQELQREKQTLRPEIRMSLEYVLLADEVDPGDHGIQKNLETLRQTAQEIECPIPTTDALKKSLGASKTRATRRSFEPLPEDAICYFCGKEQPNEEYGIRVAMCSCRRPVHLLFDKATEYDYTDVFVPRCCRCRNEHRALPGRVKQWEKARAAIAEHRFFPDFVREIESTGAITDAAREKIDHESRRLGDAQAAVGRANSLGKQCDRCNAQKSWENHLCRRCDKYVFRLGLWSWVKVVCTMMLVFACLAFMQQYLGTLSMLVEYAKSQFGWIAGDFEQYAPFVISGVVPFGLGLALTTRMKLKQRDRRLELQAQRAEEFPIRKKAALTVVKDRLKQAQAALDVARNAEKKAAADYENAKKKLQMAKDQAIVDFERASPKPALAQGIKPENSYLNFHRIKQLRTSGYGNYWGFGRAPQDECYLVRETPVGVSGLVVK
ncbi:MAG: hypothetical protein ACRER2_04145 [Methylococcales bacterium]